MDVILEKRPSKSVENNFTYHPPKPGQAEKPPEEQLNSNGGERKDDGEREKQKK